MKTTLTRRHFVETLARTSLGVAGGMAFFTGCSKNDKSDTEQKTLKPLSCQLAWVKDAEFMGYYIALEKGWYREGEPGLEVSLLPGGPDVIPESTLLSKRADIALTTPDTTVNLIVKDKAPLKIIGAQYQKSPLGVVSLEKNPIRELTDLIGKTIAVSPVTIMAFESLLRLNGIDKAKVKIVPYQYNVDPLMNGVWDATIDFVTNVPYTIKTKGGQAHHFLLWDKGFTVFNDTVVVTEETLRSRRNELIAWLRASRKGWEENYIDHTKYPPLFEKTHFAGTGRTVENEVFFNEQQKALMQPVSGGFFSMSEKDIQGNIDALQRIGLAATRSMFDTEVLKEAFQQ